MLRSLAHLQGLARNGGVLPRLSDCGFRVFSQFEEDGLIVYLAAVLEISTKVFIDVGAGDGIGSNCANLAVNHGWTGLFVDGDAVGMGRGEDAGGHPADGVVWLVGQLAARGERVRAGDVVITGGLTAAVALDVGIMVHATFEVVPPVVPVRVSVVR